MSGAEQVTRHAPRVSEAQQCYARWLGIGSAIGVGAVLLSFLVYASGLVAPRLPIDQLPSLWTQPSQAMMDATGLAPGLGWASMLGYSDMLNLLGVALLAGCSVAPLVAAIPVFWRNGARTFVVMCVLEILVMVVAGSGVLTAAVH